MNSKRDDDFIDSSLQDGLFTLFAESFKDKQVIIIDNKQPPKNLSGKYARQNLQEVKILADTDCLKKIFNV